MTRYDDDVVSLDDTGITIKNYFLPGRPRHIRYADIVEADLIPLAFATGRHQRVGIGLFRPRLFFHWDRKRSTKSEAVSLDIGKWLRVAITPDNPHQVLEELHDRSA